MKNGNGTPSTIHSAVLQTCLGQVEVAWDGARLASIRLGRFGRVDIARPALMEGNPPDPAGQRLIDALAGYFSGEPVRFHDLPDMSGFTAFQGMVWRATRDIPYGVRRTYSDVANAVGRPKAPRAVGAALGKNPFVIVVPCHRVVGASGALTGFAYGGEWKAALLALEENGWQGERGNDGRNRL
ncbi:MAG: methylated-DNA--[protein]-cysteine S-methyltransferase [Gemmatimonadetes bacterium]|nr:methylated-DNA--[protein]-cysteine S-methyltransferase [Gemmatimonadota bacterium]